MDGRSISGVYYFFCFPISLGNFHSRGCSNSSFKFPRNLHFQLHPSERDGWMGLERDNEIMQYACIHLACYHPLLQLVFVGAHDRLIFTHQFPKVSYNLRKFNFQLGRKLLGSPNTIKIFHKPSIDFQKLRDLVGKFKHCVLYDFPGALSI